MKGKTSVRKTSSVRKLGPFPDLSGSPYTRLALHFTARPFPALFRFTPTQGWPFLSRLGPSPDRFGSPQQKMGSFSLARLGVEYERNLGRSPRQPDRCPSRAGGGLDPYSVLSKSPGFRLEMRWAGA